MPEFPHNIPMMTMSCANLIGSTLLIICLVISMYPKCMTITSGLSSSKVGSTKCFDLLIVEPRKTIQ